MHTSRLNTGSVSLHLVAAALLLVATPVGSSAQTLSAPSLSNASSTDEFSGSSANPSYQRASGTQTLSTGGTSFQTRYFGNASADCGIACSSRTETLSSNYTVSWNVTAPASLIYRLTIDTRRTAGLTCVDEGTGNCVSSMNALSCTPSGGTLVSGACTLADPADNNTNGTSDVNVNQTASMVRCGQGTGSAQAFSMNYTWSQSAQTPSTAVISINSDESAVRLGANDLDTSNTASDYPGQGGRTQSNDGHFTTVTVTNLCGNGTIDSCGAAAEQCDDGVNNGTPGSCCTTSCTFKPNGTACTDDGNVCTADTCNGSSNICQHPAGNAGVLCRASAGECDPQEVCDGTNTTCPADAKSPSGTGCTSDSNPCTLDQCDGSSNACQHPAGNAGALCRASAGECDPQELCDGSNTSCPADVKSPSGTGCSSDSNPCTLDECDGSNNACQHPAGNAGALCRASTGECDPQEVCDGSNTTCPADTKSSIGTPCGDPSDTVCDDPDTCDGLGTCQPNYESPTVVCRAATTGGVCDEVENCDGAGNCPADGFKPNTVVCRPSAGECDVTENCTGTSPFCPSDAFEPPTTTCGSSLDDDCTNPDTCSGTSNTCLANDEANGLACGDPNNTECDNPDTCNGTGTCLANKEPSGTACGDPSNTDCTDPDTCDGAGSCQPNNEIVGFPCGDPSATDCTNPDTCNGSGTCQTNDQPVGAPCGDPSDTVCDNPDTCNGSGTCQLNHEPTTVVCRAATSGGACDEVENCDGAGNCPADGFKPSTVECRAAVGECDTAENCTGTAPFCPSDGVKSSGTVCTGDGNLCTLDQCDGTSTLCQHPAGNAGTTCRAAVGDCDVAETCNGTSTTCPADGFKAVGAACGSSTNTDCTDPDTCNGAGVCLANNATDGTSCEDGNACTTGEACTNGTCAGGSGTCPLDHYKCYQGKDLKNPKFTKTTATTTDQISTGEAVELQKVKFVCTPVNKNGEGISDPSAHLTCYQIKANTLSPRPKLQVSTQFQSSQFQAKKGKLLCVPSSKTIIP